MLYDGISEFEAVSIDVSKLPSGIAIKVNADPDDIEKDNLQGQNILGFATTVLANPLMLQAMLPYLDIILPAMGIKPQKAKELQKRVQAQLLAKPPMPMGPPPGGAPPGEGPPEGEPENPETNADQAYSAIGG